MVSARRPFAIATLAMGMLITGCTSDDDPSSPATSTAPTSTVVAKASSDPFCRFVAAFDERFGRIDPSLRDPAQLRTRFQDAANTIAEAAAVAPPEIKADVGLLDQAYKQLLAVLQQAGFDFTKVSPTALQTLQTPAFADASTRLDAYRARTCG